MKVIITRDKRGAPEDDRVFFWKSTRKITYRKGIYVGISFVVGCQDVVMGPIEFKKLFGFTPRYGSKETCKLKLIRS